MGMNNLPKVVTRQRGGWESNSQPAKNFSCSFLKTEELLDSSVEHWLTNMKS